MAERFSRHAAERVGQHRIKAEDVDLVLRFDKEIHRAGAVFVFLGHRDIPEQLRHDRCIFRSQRSSRNFIYTF